MAEFSKIPGACNITAVYGDELGFSLQFNDQATPPQPLNLTGYTFEAKVYEPAYDNPEGGFGSGDFIMGDVAATITVSPVSLSTGQLSIGLSEAQTLGLSPAQKYRWYLRWVDTVGITSTVLSGEFVIRIP